MQIAADTRNDVFLTITDQAETHFKHLLEKEATEGLNLRLSVLNPGTYRAEVSITFCPKESQEPTDIPHLFSDYVLFIDKASEAALKDAHIDYVEDEMGGQLPIKAPCIKGSAPSKDSPLAEKIEYAIQTDINPSLASHGGFVTLVEVVDESIVRLRLGGGCQGCGMANVTLKEGIEKSLKEQFPMITEVQDVTNHATGENPYYK